MRKIIALSFITLDGVMQSPGAPEEDTSGGFAYGGWVAPYNDDSATEIMKKMMAPADLLLGRTTFEIWEHYWPQHADIWPGINEATKYVLSTTRDRSDWSNCVFFNSISDIQKLKSTEGGDIKAWGSSKLVQSLLKHNMVDELWLMIHPITLGKGKKLFNDESAAAAFILVETTVTRKGVIIAHYKRAGDVKTGRVAE